MFNSLSAFACVLVVASAVRLPHQTANVNDSITEWDYIVAGAGPAGIIVAERLAEQNKNVLLLDVGGPSIRATGGTMPPTWSANNLTVYDIPSQSPSVFTTGATKFCDFVPSKAGCLLGGGVEVNAMIFVHPPSHDFDDNWPAGWKWNDVEPAANSFYARNPGTTSPSRDGILYDNAAYDIMGDYLSTIGYEAVDAIEQPNLKNATYSFPPSNIINGERAGPLVSYYPLAQNMTNFKLQMYTKVLCVVRDGSKITGVEVENVNTGIRSTINIAFDGRVVLAAGAMSTPAILINSGIGPADQINIVANGTTNLTLPARQDWIELPVGTQIKDHPIVSVNFNTSADLNMTLYPFANPHAADQQAYLSNKTGVLTQGYQRIVFWNSFVGSDGKTRYVQGTTGVASNNQLSIKLYLTHGLTSVGQLGMAANGSTIFITEPYFSDPVDAQGLESFITNFTNQVISRLTTLTPATNLTAAEMLTAKFAVGDHFVGTAKMGENDGTSVVDMNTKVYGTDNLFVVDASIHPDLPTGNTQCIIMIVAEKAAQLISAL